MFHSARDLLKYTIKADDMSAQAEDILFDTRELKLRHVVVDIGPWFTNQTAVVSADRFKVPETDSRDWPAELTRAEAEAAPGLDAIGDGHEARADMPFYTAWPPVIVGVAGETVSPLLLRAQVEDRLGESAQNPDTEGAEPEHLHSLSNMLGAPVHGRDGQLAKLVDLLIDPDTMSVHHLVIDTGNLLPQRQMVVPAGVIRRLPRDGEPLEANLTERQLEESPALQDIDEIDRNWIDGALAYYGLRL